MSASTINDGATNNRANRYRAVGHNLPGVDDIAKLSGKAVYTSDLGLPGMLQLKILRSPHAHARIRAIDAVAARALPGVVDIATGADLGGIERCYGMYLRDQPILAVDTVRHVGDPVACVAAVDEASALAALALIRVEYAPLPALMTIADALAPEAPPLFTAKHDAALPAPSGNSWIEQEPAPNILVRCGHEIGDVDAALARCHAVFEDTFTFARLSHYALEPFVALAAADGDQVQVWSNNQDPFLLREDISRIFGLKLADVRFHNGLVGGGFGGKSYCKLEPLTVLMARRTGRPVRLALSLDETMLMVCEHGAILKLRTGVDAQGRLLARDARVDLDGGAYADASPAVAGRVADRMAGPYAFPALRSIVQVVRTNTIPAGSFRGFGCVHVTWAAESQMDMIARRLGIDPLDIRYLNLLRKGDSYTTGQKVDVDLTAGLTEVARRIGYHATRAPGRGIGIAAGLKAAGAKHRAEARVAVSGAGRATVWMGVADIGQGTRTVMTQIAAEALGVASDTVTMALVDTDETPYENGTHSSAGITVSGRAVREAADAAIARCLDLAARVWGCAADELVWEAYAVHRGRERRSLAELLRQDGQSPDSVIVGEGRMDGSSAAYWMPSWTAVEVEVDPELGSVRLHHMVAAADAGQAIHPDRCRSQVAGAAVQGLGQALFEDLAYDGEFPVGAEPRHYRVPRIADLPDRFEAVVLEGGDGPGPFGARGIGEAGNLTVATAIANAIDDATGARVVALPITPPRLLAALDARFAGSPANPSSYRFEEDAHR